MAGTTHAVSPWSGSQYKAVIFDIGGVVVGSPFRAIAAYEVAHQLPPNYINCLITAKGEDGAYQRFERGECSLSEFYDDWGRELNDLPRGNAAYKAYAQRRGLALPRLPESLNIDVRELFGKMMRESQTIDEGVANAIQKIRAHGQRVIALTNNYSKEDDTSSDKSDHAELGWDAEGAVPSRVREMFDDWVDSSLEGLRKPDPRFFELALRRNGLKPTEVVFLDDIGANLKAAAALGITAIQVPIGQSDKALRQLESRLGYDVTSRVVQTTSARL